MMTKYRVVVERGYIKKCIIECEADSAEHAMKEAYIQGHSDQNDWKHYPSTKPQIGAIDKVENDSWPNLLINCKR